ncbi:hypothetical protein FOMPIDRAFT_1022372, partial [Fomitopsis schrenkii]
MLLRVHLPLLQYLPVPYSAITTTRAPCFRGSLTPLRLWFRHRQLFHLGALQYPSNITSLLHARPL